MHPYVYDTNLDQTAMTPADCPANAWNPWVSCPYDLNDGQQDELVAIRTVMDNNGDSAKAIWLTEFGCPTANPAICDDSTLSTQITDTYEQANANPGNEYGLLGPMLFYSWTDADATNDPSGTGYDNYGLYTDAGTPKTLSLTAFLNSTPVGSVSSPEVTINSPSSNAYAHGNSATADVTLTDNDGGSVVNGQLYLNGSLLSTLTSSPYDFSYSTLGLSDGTYPVQIDSSDSLSQSNSGSVNVIVNNGDLNDDGSVDISDLAIMAANWGSTTASYAQGSILSDGNVDISDLAIMASNWGWSA
jgi:hypothetical protein